MKNAHPLLVIAAMGFWFGAVPAHAYVDIELNNGRHVVGESYGRQGEKLIVYRHLGAIEIDRGAVRSIQERTGEMPAEAQRNIEPAVGSSEGTAAPLYEDFISTCLLPANFGEAIAIDCNESGTEGRRE